MITFAAMNDKQAIEKAGESLKSGGVILCPTDTIWGISCDATNEKAVEKLKSIKNRPANKSFIVLINSIRMLNQIFKEIPNAAWDIMEYADSPLTLILDEASYVSENVMAEDGSLGVRMVRSGLCLKVISALNRPLVSTSANFSQEPTPLHYEAIKPELKAKLDFCFPNTITYKPATKPSKIIKIKRNGEVRIIRN